MDVRTGSITRRFSDLQWYFAKAKNTVHFVSYSPRTITEEEFKAFAYRVLSRAPQLLLEESVQHESLRQLSRVDIEALIEHRTCESLDLPLSLVREHLGAEFSDTGMPAYRARCWSANKPDTSGYKSVFVMESTHSVMEGIDVSDVLRGRRANHHQLPEQEFRQSFWSRVVASAAVPLMLPFHLLMARLEKKDATEFSYVSVSMPRRKLAETARRFDVTQRSLLFALVLVSAVEKARLGKTLYFAFTRNPNQRQRNLDDDYVSFRTQEMRIKGSGNVIKLAKAIDDRQQARRGDADLSQALIKRLLAAHRWLNRSAPWIYPKKFFGFAPHDILLSMAPPAHPGAEREFMMDSVNFAGSNTGTGQNCIFVVSNEAITLNFWASQDMLARLPLLQHEAKKLGLELPYW